MANYYCLMAGLPDIELSDTHPGYTFEQLKEQCDESLTKEDKKLLFFFFLKYDCMNIVRLLKDPDAEVDPLGNFSLDQYRDLLTSARELNFNVHRYPSFMSIFAREYSYNKDTEGYFPEDEMMLAYLQYCLRECPDKTMKKWYQLTLDINNILTAMIARKQGWNVTDFIMGDGVVQEMIRENKTKDFDLSLQYDYVKELMKIVDEEDPVRKEKMIDALKWTWLDDATFFEPFDIDALFAYLCKLEIQRRWEKLDVEQGKETFKQIIENLRGEAKVPDEFIQK